MKALVAPQLVVIPLMTLGAAPEAAMAAERVMTTLVPTVMVLAATCEPALPSALPSVLLRPGTQSITGTNDVTTPTPNEAASCACDARFSLSPIIEPVAMAAAAAAGAAGVAYDVSADVGTHVAEQLLQLLLVLVGLFDLAEALQLVGALVCDV